MTAHCLERWRVQLTDYLRRNGRRRPESFRAIPDAVAARLAVIIAISLIAVAGLSPGPLLTGGEHGPQPETAMTSGEAEAGATLTRDLETGGEELDATLPLALGRRAGDLATSTFADQAGPIDALALLGADSWQAAGFTGHGLRIAIIDAGFEGYLGALGNSLPSTVRAQSFTASGDLEAGTDHGLRAAEIVHRVAPGAELYLINFGSAQELSAAVDFTIDQQIDIVSFSLGFIHSGPGDGSGDINDIVTRSTSAGTAWVVAAGNWAQQHWAGPFTDGDGDSIHEFEGGVEENRHAFTAGDLIVISLRWADVWGASCADYDIELFGPDGSLVRASRRIQDCSGNPVESLQVLATQTGDYSVRVIQAHADTAKDLDLMVVGSPDRGAPLEFIVEERSLSEPADHPSVISVGVVAADGASEEVFSSRGPTVDGRTAPAVLGPAGVQTSTTRAFAGTSAAAPHVAGAVALLIEALGRATPADIADELAVRARAGESGAVVRLGSLAGLGELLPEGAADSVLIGSVPSGDGLALVTYVGVDGYPLRFAHLLLGGRDIAAGFRVNLATGQFQQFIRGAPDWVNAFTRMNSGDLLVLRLEGSQLEPQARQSP